LLRFICLDLPAYLCAWLTVSIDRLALFISMRQLQRLDNISEFTVGELSHPFRYRRIFAADLPWQGCF